MAVFANPVMKFGLRRVLTIDGVGNAALVYTELDRGRVAYDANSDPDGTEGGAAKQALTTGAATIDLTAFPDIEGGTLDLTGLKPRHIFFYNPSANVITVSEGASNGYTLLGGDDIDIPPGARIQMDLLDTQAAVAAGDKELDLAGTDDDELWIGIIAG